MQDEVAVLVAEAAQVGVELGRDEACQLLRLLDLVATAPLNLTAVRDRTEMRRKHVVDCLACLPVAHFRSGERCVDLGSGGGFPGVPLAIVCPWLRMQLVDATAKKVAFLAGAVRQLGLENVAVHQARAETLGRAPGWREAVDCVVARAVAPLPTLAEYTLPLCRVGGRVLAFKGSRAGEEIAAAARAVKVLGGAVGDQRAFVLPGGGASRVVVRIDKVVATPMQFPRGLGIPSRRPL